MESRMVPLAREEEERAQYKLRAPGEPFSPFFFSVASCTSSSTGPFSATNLVKMPYPNQHSPMYYSCAGVRSIRAAKRLEKALAEVVGLLAGFTHLGEIEPASKDNRSSHRQDGLALEVDSLRNTSPANSASDSQPDSTDPRNQARENAWAPIRTVREGMQILSNIPSVFLVMPIPLLPTTSRRNAMTPRDFVKQETARRSACDSGGDTWIECLGDLGSYRMAIEDDDIRD